MRGRIVVLLALMQVVTLGLAAEQSDVLLYLPFDGSIEPRISAEGTEVTATGPVEFVEGKLGQALRVGDGAALLELPAKGNVLAERGTVEFWVCPLDWRGDDEKFHEFFATSRTGWILLYKYMSPGSLLFLLADDRAQQSWLTARANIGAWEPGQWHHLAATWRAAEMAVYVDGQKTSSVPNPLLPPDVGETIRIGDRPWHIERDARSLIDELYVYKRALTAAEIQAAYLRAAPLAESDRPLITLQKTTEVPDLDGRAFQGEFEEACGVSGFVDNITGELSRRDTWVYLSRDDRALYAAFLSKRPEPGLVDAVRERDGHVWEDDAIEIFLDPSNGTQTDAYYHLIINPSGVCYTSRGKDKPDQWNPDLEVASDTPADVWMVELAIPWEELGGPPAEGDTWGLNLCRDWQRPKQWTSWSHVRDFHDQSSFGRIVFEDAPFVKALDFGKLERGQVKVVVSSRGMPASAQVRVLAGEQEVFSQAAELRLAAGEVALLLAETELADSGAYRLELAVKRDSDGQVCYRMRVPFTYFPALQLACRPRPQAGLWEIMADITGWRGEQEGLTAEFEVVSPQGKSAWKGAVSEFERDTATAQMPEKDLPPGQYRIVGRLLSGGEEVATAEATQIKPDVTAWLGNDLYQKVEVLPPWTPVEVQGTTVRTWGREYAWEGPLPARIISQGEQMLARPIALRVTTAEGEVTWGASKIQVTDRSDASATIEGSTAGGQLVLSTRCTTEFDGMTRVDLELAPQGAVEVQSVRLEVPVRGAVAKYRHCLGPWSAEVSGAVPEGEGQVWSAGRFTPYYWLGDEERGLMWFCESTRGWVKGERPAQRVERRGDEVVLIIEPVAAPTNLEEPWRWTFGLHATPVKPFPERWRSLRMAPGPGARVQILWASPSRTKYFGYPEATDPDEFQAEVDGLRENGVMSVPYSCLRMISEQSAEWQYYGSVWEVPGHADRGASDVLRYAAAFMGACPFVESYADFIVFKNKQFVERHGLGGLYHDWTVPIRCRNEGHGCGWRDAEGNLQGRYPIFAARDLYRRIYAMLKDQPHETFMMGHMSARVLIPMLSFCDAYLDAEQFRSRVTDDYTEALPLDAFRAEFMGKQWGVIPYFLPELAAEAQKGDTATRHLLSLTMLHDTPVWAVWCNSATVAKVREALDEFGYADAEFLGYWHNDSWLSCEQEGVEVSAYRLEGRVMLIISNLSAQAQKVSLKVNLEELGVPGASARNAETGEAIPLENGTITVGMPRRNLALMELDIRD